MKKKKINKKLILVKQTITNLNETGMLNIKGGMDKDTLAAPADTLGRTVAPIDTLAPADTLG